jgi:hypothetical protein
MLKIGNKI